MLSEVFVDEGPIVNSDVVTECPVDFAGQGGAPEVLNLAAYKFAALKDLNSLRRELKNLADQLGLRGTILLSPEGINLFVAGHKESVDRLIDRIHLIPGLEDLSGKQSFTSHQPFHRMLVKIKKEIIAFGIDEVRPAEWTSPKLSASELRRWLNEGRDITLLDVRNDYEIKLGTFRNAVDFGLKHFRHFPAAAADWTTSAKDKPLVMFCTGGIRCEKAGPYMEKIGFKNIFQLDGGILKYFEECGGDHYEGSCFVFDQRVAVGPDLNPTGDAICFACQATLTHKEMQSPNYEVGVSCPHCYREPDEIKKEQTMQRQALLQSIASSQPGCQPYANVRFTHVPRRLAGLALIDCLDQWHPGYGRDRWQHELEMGNLWKEGERVTSDRVVKEGERFEHRLENCVEPAVATDIRILLEEEGFIVVEKPAPLPCHPSGRYNKNTLQSFLNEVYHPQKIRLMHRLDANTSGLILAARIYKAAKNLQRQFQELRVEKKYLARVHGCPVKERFECDRPIGRHPLTMGARVIDENGLPARTQFRLLARMEGNTSLMEAIPLTGRTHQIRLHLQSMGFPIVNDPLYGLDKGTQTSNKPALGTSMCLHANELSFCHPSSGERIHVRSESTPTWATR